MGHISKKDVVNIAHLSRIDLSDEEIETFSGQLESILGYMDKLSEVDIEGVEPFISAAAEGNVFREDITKPSLANEDALANSPRKGDGFFKVPQVT